MFEVVAILDGSEMELKEIFGVDDLLKKTVGSPSSAGTELMSRQRDYSWEQDDFRAAVAMKRKLEGLQNERLTVTVRED